MGMVHAYKKGELDTSDMDVDLLAKVKKIAKDIKSDDAKDFAATKHKGLPEIKESAKLTFKQYLFEMTDKQRRLLTPPAAIQKIYATIKHKHGLVKRDVFMMALADRFNLTPKGLKRLISQPHIKYMRFDDEIQKPDIKRKDPWDHIKSKHRGSEATANRQLGGNRPLSQEKQNIIARLGG